MKILYVDDNLVNRIVFERLMQTKVEVKVCKNFKEALENANSEFYDVFVIDLNLADPDRDGFDVLTEIKKLDMYIQTKAIYFAFTAYSGKEWEDKCKEAGFDYFISKPLDPKEILSKIGL